jgi:hypothetical protein
VLFPFRPTHLIFPERSGGCWHPQRNSHFSPSREPPPLLCLPVCVPSRNTIIIPATSDKSFCLPTTRKYFPQAFHRSLCVTKRAARAKSAPRANARLQMRRSGCKIKRPRSLSFCIFVNSAHHSCRCELFRLGGEHLAVLGLAAFRSLIFASCPPQWHVLFAQNDSLI